MVTLESKLVYYRCSILQLSLFAEFDLTPASLSDSFYENPFLTCIFSSVFCTLFYSRYYSCGWEN